MEGFEWEFGFDRLAVESLAFAALVSRVTWMNHAIVPCMPGFRALTES